MPQFLISKSTFPFSVAPSFSKNIEIPGQDQQNGKRTQRLITKTVLQDNLKDTSSHSFINSFGLYLSPEYLSDFLSKLYVPPWLGKSFKFVVFRLLKNGFASQKIESTHFYSYTQAKLSPRFLQSSPRQRKITHPPTAAFFENLLPEQERRGTTLKFPKFRNKRISAIQS